MAPTTELVYHSPEQSPHPIGITIAFRVYVREYTPSTLFTFSEQIKNIAYFAGGKTSDIRIITNQDLPQQWIDILAKNGLSFIPADIWNENGQLSNANLLNAATNDITMGSHILFASADYARKGDQLIEAQHSIFSCLSALPEGMRNTISLIGPILDDIHSVETITNIFSGQNDLTFPDLPFVLPNNAVALVKAGTTFSSETDNGHLGKIMLENGKETEVGGNEDFYTILHEAIYNNKIVLLNVSNRIQGRRDGEVSSHSDKQARRLPVYKKYAKQIIEHAIRDRKIDLNEGELTDDQVESITMDVMDSHFFFVHQNTFGGYDVQLTKRQQQKGIRSPFERIIASAA